MMDHEKIKEGVRLMLEGIGEDVQSRRFTRNTRPYRQNVRADLRRAL